MAVRARGTHDSKVLPTPTALTTPTLLECMHDSRTLSIAVQRAEWLDPDPWSRLAVPISPPSISRSLVSPPMRKKYPRKGTGEETVVL